MFNLIESDKKSIFFIGDVHGEFKVIGNWVKNFDLSDCAIVFCGDFGLGFSSIQHERSELLKSDDICEERNVDCYMIRGNHDDPKIYNTDATDAEIKAYWDSTVGVYTGTNPWVSLDNALNINWADMESRVRGQNAFGAGHTYCKNHLRACNYMSNNMRDAYKTEITRDCAAYESSLEKIQNAAESVIETYKK